MRIGRRLEYDRSPQSRAPDIVGHAVVIEIGGPRGPRPVTRTSCTYSRYVLSNDCASPQPL